MTLPRLNDFTRPELNNDAAPMAALEHILGRVLPLFNLCFLFLRKSAFVTVRLIISRNRCPAEGRDLYNHNELLTTCPYYPRGSVFRNVPRSRSSKACRSSSCVFITIGPYQATGSSSGFPETRRNRMPSSPAWIVISSPRSKSTSERLSASRGGVVSAHLIPSVGTARGTEALQNFPSPAKT